ncbi:hypothetical protein AbraIFM66951_011830 [Aspergillus brasiliensis]|uniref:ribonuclease H n=1 Tax=Aspergillus brasiliensis TaxID=319629 RepID=A0A9W5YXG8_9EURO|nr:hypothetical protein AbraCBS73388_011752 [Aspergillus brasiliensis]GKZ48076.1 hypothetical protein AbraIFM66951_011830 [Aspergillus brasiliensis]
MAHQSTPESTPSGISPVETKVPSTCTLPASSQANTTLSRRFHPEIYPKEFKLSDIEVPSGDVVHTACPASKRGCPCSTCPGYCKTSIVIAIDGARCKYGRRGAQASIGVYHGPNHDWNASALVSPELKQLPQVAVLAACEKALLNACTLQNYWGELAGMVEEGTNERLREVVIKTDSEFLVSSMTELIFKWKANGWLNAQGLQVINRDQFLNIESLIESLENNMVTVRFWHVPRTLNQDADRLARSALKYH